MITKFGGTRSSDLKSHQHLGTEAVRRKEPRIGAPSSFHMILGGGETARPLTIIPIIIYRKQTYQECIAVAILTGKSKADHSKAAVEANRIRHMKLLLDLKSAAFSSACSHAVTLTESAGELGSYTLDDHTVWSKVSRSYRMKRINSFERLTSANAPQGIAIQWDPNCVNFFHSFSFLVTSGNGALFPYCLKVPMQSTITVPSVDLLSTSPPHDMEPKSLYRNAALFSVPGFRESISICKTKAQSMTNTLVIFPLCPEICSRFLFRP